MLLKQANTKVGHQIKIIIPLTHLLKLYKKISNQLKFSNLNNHIRTSIKLKERQLKNYSKEKISSLLTLMKEELLSL